MTDGTQKTTDEKGPPWLISRELHVLHESVIEYAVDVHRRATHLQQKRAHVSYRALAILHMRAVTIHRSVLVLCELGWTPVTSILIRTLLDLYANVIAILLEPENTEFMGFRYLAHPHLTRLHDTTVPKAERERIRVNMDAAAVQLPEPDIARAKELLSSYPRRSYWYSPEFESPNAVLSNTKGEMTFIYRLLSGSVHGGTVGLGFLDDNPDEFDINARNHPRRSPLAIALSSRLLLETTFLRDSGE